MRLAHLRRQRTQYFLAHLAARMMKFGELRKDSAVIQAVLVARMPPSRVVIVDQKQFHLLIVRVAQRHLELALVHQMGFELEQAGVVEQKHFEQTELERQRD